MSDQKIKAIFSVVLTLLIIQLLPFTKILPFILITIWFALFRPFSRSEIVMFIIAAVFIIGQNYSVLKSGGFTFTQQDFLLMPYYEPFMWGFYYLNMKRFISEAPGKGYPRLEFKALLGLIATAVCFSLFSGTSRLLFFSSLISTTLLLLLFHDRYDIYYGVYALCLGFIIEFFGVATGLWSYPNPDFIGIPFWFGTMWISVGLLGRRFLIPLSELIDSKLLK